MWDHPFSGRVRAPLLLPAPPAAAEAKQLASALLRHGDGTSPAVQGWPVPSLWAALAAQRSEELACLEEREMGQGEPGSPQSHCPPLCASHVGAAAPLHATESRRGVLFFTPLGMKPSPELGQAPSCTRWCHQLQQLQHALFLPQEMIEGGRKWGGFSVR